jgi:Tol biopolymer transport system component
MSNGPLPTGRAYAGAVRRVGVVLGVVVALGVSPASAHGPPGHVAFTRVRNGHSAIWTMNAFGTGLHPVAAGSSPAWSLTGTRIAFTARGSVWTMAADGTGRRRLALGGEPAWAPDGDHLVFSRAGALWVLGADGRGLRRLTTGGAPAWSPDATTVAYERSGSIWTVPAAGGDARLLIHNAGEPAWSLDARSLAFTSTRARFGARDVFVADADGSHVRRVTHTRADERSPSWSPDGVWIATASNRSGRYAIWLVSLSPPEVIRATVDRWSDLAPAWGL